MKTLQFRFLAGFLLSLLGAVSCTQPTHLQVSAVSPDQVLGYRVFEQVNTYRKSKGTGPLKPHPGLSQLAVKHSEYMRKNRGTFNLYGKNVTHAGSEGRSLVAMKVYNFINSSENVASCMKAGSDSESAGRLVYLWSHSPKHEAAMSAPEFTHTGVGIVTDSDGTIFATQLFGTLTNSQLSTRDRFNSF